MDVRENIIDSLLMLDPVYFAEKYLTIDGASFNFSKRGYKPFTDIYRYIGIKALEKNSKPLVIVAGRQVGKSTMAAVLELYFMTCGLFGGNKSPPIRVIHAFPFLEMSYTYSKVALASMIANSSSIESENKKKSVSFIQSKLDMTSPTNDSLQFKQFVGSNHLWIDSTGLSGDRLRGRTCDCIIYDECQSHTREAINNTNKILTKANYGPTGSGVQVYLGTPLMRGSYYWDMWNNSTQQYYHLGCEKCKKYFPLYTPNSNEWENIWLYGYIVKCSHCGYEQDKRNAVANGKWVGIKSQEESSYIGFHINQLFVPDYTKEKILSEKPGASVITTERAYQNEVLGEFFQGETSIMTPEQVRSICGDPEKKFRASISPAEDLLVFAGIDIGAKNDIEQLANSDKVKPQGQSYSTVVVVAMTGPEQFSIVYASKFKRNDLASKKGFIDQLMRQYSVNLAVCDIGYANDFNEIMQTEYGNKFLSSQSLPRVNDHVKFNDQVFPKIIAFEKDFWIADLYNKMRNSHIRFPLGDYEKIAWLIQHCTSMEIKPSISRTGDVTPHYVKGSSPNDGWMSLLNAYIAYKFYISEGFSIKNKFAMKDGNKKNKPPILTAYLPRLR